MILLCGIPTEPPIAAVIDRLETLEYPYVLFNQREFESTELDWTVSGGRIAGSLTLPEAKYALSSFTGIYIRLMDDRMLPELEDEPAGSPRLLSSRRFHESLITWTDLSPARVVNRFCEMGSNGSKPYQAQFIRRAGFSIPETLVTNDPSHVRAFADRHQRIIYKSISGIRSIIAEMDTDAWNRIEAIRSCPVQFQRYIPGYDVRVHTVGTTVFATRIDSARTDYRYAGTGEGGANLTPYDLPKHLEERCLRLAADLRLPFAGIDLRITPDGEAVCFEVNPSPAYSYYEAHTDQPISLALAHYLRGSDR